MQPNKQTAGMAERLYMAYNAGPWQPRGQCTATATFLIVRHYARSIHQNIANVRAKIAKAKRQASLIDDSPFNRHRKKLMSDYIESLSALARTHRESQQRFGRFIIDMAPSIDAVTTMTQRLELLNCNPADQADLTEPDIGLVELIAVYCVEDSAAHRRDEFNDRPLHAAVNAEILRFMRETREGRAASEKIFDEAFAPGGIFHGMPTYYLQPDGTMKRKAPALVLYEASGSRVIEREPS
ncbi:hypothetical protein [Massilia sp.]|uniref:hypothetical protein n=1 Tax=Massilia sp. TaxID=1882437 RepID=UPI00352FE733